MLPTNFRPFMLFEEDKGAGGEPQGGDPPANKPEPETTPTNPPTSPETWDAYLATLPDEQRKLVESLHESKVTGLKSALDAERAANKENAPKIKRLADLEAEEEKRRKAQMSELEQAQEEARQAKEEALKANSERERVLAEAASQALKTAVLLKASEMGFEHPEDAYALADLAIIETDESGKFSNLEAVLEPIKSRLPLKGGKQTKSQYSPTNPGAAGSQQETDAQKKARLFGSSADVFNPVINERMGGGAFIVEKQE